MKKFLTCFPALLILALCMIPSLGNASCTARFRIAKVTDKSFKVIDSSICNRSTTTFHVKVFDGSSNTYYNNYNVNSPATITWNRDVSLWVTLTIQDSSSNCSDSTGGIVVITGNTTCNPKFAHYFPNFPSLNVYFASQSTNYTANTKYFYDFKDGITANTRNTSHTFSSCGTKVVRLKVKDSVYGCYDSADIEVRLNLKAEFTPHLYFGKSWYFMNQTNYGGMPLGIPDSLTKSYHWDFGDGDTSNAFNAQHTYANAGTYTVKLYANFTHPNNPCNQRDSFAFVINVGCKGAATFTYDRLSTRTYTFHAPGNKNLLYTWGFDGTGSSTSSDPTYTFPAVKKKYLITFMLQDTIGQCTDTLITYLYHQCNIRTSLTLFYDSTQPYQATLTNNSTGYITNHYWDFGDGNTSTSASPVHSYSITGPIRLIYTATDTMAPCSYSDTLNFAIDTMGNIKRQAFTMTIVDKTENAKTSVKAVKSNLNLKVYPNPFGNCINIETGYMLLKNVVLYTVTGAAIPVNVQSGNGVSTIHINEAMPAGIYILKVATNEGVNVYRLIKE